MTTATLEDQARFEAFLLQQGREFAVSRVAAHVILRFVRLDDFDTDHQTETANVANHRVAFLQLGQFTFQPLALGGDFVGDLVVAQMTQGGQAGGHRQLVAAEGAGVVTRFPGVELLF